jgi:hypothetical protein
MSGEPLEAPCHGSVHHPIVDRPLYSADTNRAVGDSRGIDAAGAGAIEGKFIGYSADRQLKTLVDVSIVHFCDFTGNRDSSC